MSDLNVSLLEFFEKNKNYGQIDGYGATYTMDVSRVMATIESMISVIATIEQLLNCSAEFAKDITCCAEYFQATADKIHTLKKEVGCHEEPSTP